MICCGLGPQLNELSIFEKELFVQIAVNEIMPSTMKRQNIMYLLDCITKTTYQEFVTVLDALRYYTSITNMTHSWCLFLFIFDSRYFK